MADYRYIVVISWPHKAMEVKARTKTMGFTSGILAAAFASKAEQEPGVKALVLDKGDKRKFEHKPFSCLSGIRV